MAGGYLTKQAILLTAAYLNSVNDSVQGGAITALPSGVQPPQYSQTIPGDRLVLDDSAASALSNSAVGTLYGGVYSYVGVLSTATAAVIRGCVAFFLAADIGVIYRVTPDVQPLSSIPTYIAGVFINAITKGNWGWIQVAGVASCLFESAITTATAGYPVTAKVGPTTPGTVDAGVSTATNPTYMLATLLGVAIGTPVTSTVSTVMLTRGTFCGRI